LRETGDEEHREASMACDRAERRKWRCPDDEPGPMAAAQEGGASAGA